MAEAARTAEHGRTEGQLQHGKQHLAGAAAQRRDELKAEEAALALLKEAEAKAAAALLREEQANAAEEAKAAAAAATAASRQRDEEAAAAKQRSDEVELAAAAAAALQSDEVAAEPADRQTESMGDESVGVPVEAFAAVERQLNALIEGGEDNQASSQEEDSRVDASHCSRYFLQASTWCRAIF